MAVVDKTSSTAGSSLTSSISSTFSSASVKSATTTVGNTIKSATGTVNTVKGDLTSFVSSAVSQVSSLLGGAEHSVAGAVSGSLGSLFSDSSTSSKNASTTNTIVPDRVNSALAKGLPKAQAFTMNPIASQSDTVKLKGQATGLSTLTSDITGSLTSLEKRFQTSVSGGLSSLTSSVKSTINSTGISGVFTDLKSAMATGMAAKTDAINAVTGAESSVSSFVSAGISDYRNMVGELATSITGNVAGLDSFYNGNLPSVTATDGSDISDLGIPRSTPAGLLGGLLSGMKTIGCDISNIGYDIYGAKQSFLAAILGLSSQLDITSIIKAITNCNHFDSSLQSIGNSLFYSKVGTNANTANTLLAGLNPSTISATPAVATAMVTNPNLTPSDTAAVSTMASTLKLSGSDIYGAGKTDDGTTVWDATKVASSPPYIVETLTADASIPNLTGGTVVDTSDALYSQYVV